MKILTRFLRFIFLLPLIIFAGLCVIVGLPLMLIYWIMTGKGGDFIPLFGVKLIEKIYVK